MSIIRGPFNLKWGDNVLKGVTEVDIEHDVDSDTYPTLQGENIELDGPYSITATITLLESDIESLSLVLPQYFVTNGGVLSTGETVNNAQGAIDVRAAACDEEIIFDNLDIESCSNPATVLRIPHARTRIDSIELDNKVMQVAIRFIGQPVQGEATLQFFKKNSIHVVS